MMTNNTIYNNEQLHQRFYNYLMDKFDGDSDEVRIIQETAEDVLPSTLNEYFGTGYASIYDIQD
jgi:hypothetical protein